MEVLITLQKHFKRIRKEKEKLARLVICTTYEWNLRLRNVLDVDLKITELQNIRRHQMILRNGESKYVVMKKVIVHATGGEITLTKRYMHLWHVFLIMMNVIVETLVTVSNGPIGFYILEQRFT